MMDNKIKIPNGVISTNYTLLNNTYYHEYDYNVDDKKVYTKKWRKTTIEIEDAETGEKKKQTSWEWSNDKKVCDIISYVGKRMSDTGIYKEYQIKKYHKTSSGMKIKKQIVTISSELALSDIVKIFKAQDFVIDDSKLFEAFLNDLTSCEHEIIEENNGEYTYVTENNAALRYGYLQTDVEDYDYDVIIDNTNITRDSGFQKIDDALFKTRGTFEGWKANMKELFNLFKDPTLLKTTLSAALAGLPLSFIGFAIDPPIYATAGRSQMGKGMLAAIQSSTCQASSRNGYGILRTASDSKVGSDIINDRLQMLTNVTTEWQDLISECGDVEKVCDKLYHHTNSTSGGKGTQLGGFRGNERYWRNPWQIYLEKNEFRNLKGGKAKRINVYEVRLEERKDGISSTIIKGDNNIKYEYLTKDNAGFAWLEYAKALSQYNAKHPKQIKERYNDIVDEMRKVTRIKEIKQTQAIALLKITHDLAIELGILPDWGPLTYAELDRAYGSSIEHKETLDEIMEKIIYKIRINDISYPNYQQYPKTQLEYDEYFQKNKHEVFARKHYEKDYEGNDWNVALIPEQVLKDMFEHFVKESKVFCTYDKKTILEKYCIQKTKGRYAEKYTNINMPPSSFGKRQSTSCLLLKLRRLDDKDEDVKEELEEQQQEESDRKAEIADRANEIEKRIRNE